MYSRDVLFFFFTDTATTEIYTLSLHDALPILIYSTCTLAPEENEMIVNFLLRNFDVEIEKLSLPLKFREGVCEWEGEKLDENVKKCLRLYPQDNNSDGFFVARIRKVGEGVKG